MEIRQLKTCFLYFWHQDSLVDQVKTLLPFNIEPLETGMKYLGYFIKANNYHICDCLWIHNRNEKKIHGWCYKWFSMGGRLILVKDKLESILVYWMDLAGIPTTILNNIKKLMINFVWSRMGEKEDIILLIGNKISFRSPWVVWD